MYIVLILLTQILLLYWLSRQLHRHLSHSLYRVLRREHATVWLMSLLFWPGVLVHELSHWLVARLLLVRAGRLTIIPQLQESGEVVMGSVRIPKTDRLRFFLIGIAPFMVGMMFLFCILGYAQQLLSMDNWLWWLLVGYGVFQVSNNMFLSASDVEGSGWLLLILALLIGAAYWLGWRLPVAESTLLLKQNYEFWQQISWWLWLPISLDAAIIILLGIGQRIFK